MKPEVAAKTKRSVPSGVFQKCDECGETVPSGQVKENLWCCPQVRLPLRACRPRSASRSPSTRAASSRRIARSSPRIRSQFRDSKRYADRLRAAQKQVGVPDAFREGRATIGGRPVSIGFFVFEFMGGSMGSVVGEKITRLFERALARARAGDHLAPRRAARACRRASCRSCRWPRRRRRWRAAGSGAAVHLRAPASDDRRRGGVVRHARRRHHRRAEGAHRLRRAARDRADDPAEAARGLPALGVPAGARHGRLDRRARRT